MHKHDVFLLLFAVVLLNFVLNNMLFEARFERDTYMKPAAVAKMIDSCEKVLPRNQTCKLVAVPNVVP